MKKFSCLCAVFTVFIILCPGINAKDDAVTAAKDMYSVLDENGEEAARAAESGSGYDLNLGISRILELGADNFAPVLSASIKSSAGVLAVILLFSVVNSLFFDDGITGSAVNVSATAAVGFVGAVEVSSALKIAVDYQNRLTEFSKLILPALTATGAAGGVGGESLMLQSGCALFVDLTVTAYSVFLVPFVYGYIAVRLGGAISGNGFIKNFSDWVKNLVMGGMRLFLMLFLGYLTLSGLAGHAADSLALRSAKTAASAIPYVGGIAGEAADAIIAGSSVIRAYLGVFGTLGILGSAILPLLSCGLGWGCHKLGVMMASAFPSSCGTEAMNVISEAMGIVFAMCAASTFLMLISVTVCAKTVGAV